ncbi:MAG TPA: hypothetical protein PLZ38_13720, partial [Spirochaetota bacterium]|nr:hypothetical protein [Spirochaetota bacterium]
YSQIDLMKKYRGFLLVSAFQRSHFFLQVVCDIWIRIDNSICLTGVILQIIHHCPAISQLIFDQPIN